MNPNSLAAYSRTEMGPKMREVYRGLLQYGPCTDRELKAAMGFTDMNQVRPRLNDLIDINCARVVCDVQCATTGKTVRLVEAVQHAVQKDLEL